jgi:hypothetical protein
MMKSVCKQRLTGLPIRSGSPDMKPPIMKTKKVLTAAEHRKLEKKLLATAKRKLPELKALLATTWDHWGYEDPIYRFYHQSFKVYRLQVTTLKIGTALQALAPHTELNPFFLKIVAEGTGKEFKLSHNADWLKRTRPMLEAFFHAQHLLLMVCKYAEEQKEPPATLPSGYATVLYLYGLR